MLNCLRFYRDLFAAAAGDFRSWWEALGFWGAFFLVGASGFSPKVKALMDAPSAQAWTLGAAAFVFLARVTWVNYKRQAALESRLVQQRKGKHLLRHLRRLRDFAVVRLQNNVRRVSHEELKEAKAKGAQIDDSQPHITPSSMPPFGDEDEREWYRLCDKWRDKCLELLTRWGLEHHLSTLSTVRPWGDSRWPPKTRKYYNEMMERLDRLKVVISEVEKHVVWASFSQSAAGGPPEP